MADESNVIASKLRLERKDEVDSGVINDSISITPAIGEGYWAYRVILGEHQAIVGFPKFSTVGIGFAVEEDWNSNLPYRTHTLDIWHHIAHNKGDANIPDEWCIEAIRLIQQAAADDRDGGALDMQEVSLYPDGRCHTCGSDERQRRNEVDENGAPCSDKWHEAS